MALAAIGQVVVGSYMAWPSKEARREYCRAYYLRNAETIKARSKARAERVKTDPELFAREQTVARERARRKAAMKPPSPPRALKAPVNRYADPNYRESCQQRATQTYLSKRDDIVWRMLGGAKQRARRDERSFELLREDIVVPSNCPICEVVLVSAPGRYISASPTLDRINNAQGYERGNVAVICMQCNRVKADASAELHERIAAYMRKGGQ